MSKATKSKKDAIEMLEADHEKVKKLFDQFEAANGSSKGKHIMEEAVSELKIHATIEEEIFYPALREQMEDQDLLNEATEEHHVARFLIAELDESTEDEDQRRAKFTVLMENVRHHIKEEEGHMFPKVRKLDLDLEDLGDQMESRKHVLSVGGVPADEEHEMVSMLHNSSDGEPESSTRAKQEKTSVGSDGKNRSRKSNRAEKSNA